MNWLASPQTDDDLVAARDFIGADNERSARDFLDAAFETFNLLAQFPQMGPLAKFSDPTLKGMRYFVLPPPFGRWLIFYQLHAERVDIRRVLYGNINWKKEPERFF